VGTVGGHHNVRRARRRVALGQAAVSELARFADAGGIPASFDRRRDPPELLRTLNRELIRMRGARARRG
jgi:hypothetical protein